MWHKVEVGMTHNEKLADNNSTRFEIEITYKKAGSVHCGMASVVNYTRTVA